MPATTRLKKFFLKGKRALVGEAATQAAGAESTATAPGGDKPSTETSAGVAADLDADPILAGADPDGAQDGNTR